MAVPILGQGFGTTQAGAAFSAPTPSTPVGIPTASVAFAAPAAPNPVTPIIAPSAPVPGSSQAAATQQQSDLAKYFPGLAASKTSLAPLNYSINPGPTINSSSGNSTLTTQDALTAAQNARTGLFNGSAPSGQVPSDNLYSSVINGIFNASQYSPGEQQALTQYNDTQSRIIQTQLAARRQIQGMQQNGDITQTQAQSFISEAQRRSDAQLADLAAQQSGNTLSLQTLGMLRQNQLGAYQNIAGFLKPEQVSPGSTLVNPITGQQTYQGTGAAPATIMQTAMSLWQQAQTAGTATYNSDGTPDLQPYLAQAQQYYGGGGSGTYGTTNGGSVSGGTQTPTGGGATQAPITQTSDGGTVSPEYGTMIATLPPAIQPYVKAGPNGVAYIDTSLLPTGLQSLAMTANSKGIPALSHDDVLGLQAIGNLYDTLNQVQGLVDTTLSSGVTGKAWNSLQAFANTYTGFKPILDNYANLRETAGKTTTALMGGIGSGFRMNNATLDTAVNNLPTPTSSLEQANVKISAVRALLDNGLRQKFPTYQGAGSLQSNGSVGQGGSIWNF